MLPLWISFILAQILFISLFPIWSQLIAYLNPVVVGLIWIGITITALFLGALWLKATIIVSRKVIHLATGLYSAILLILLFFRPNYQPRESINLIPFETIQLYLSEYADPLVAFYNLGANVVLFMPFGIYYRFISKSPKLLTLVFYTVLTISIIEASQLLTDRGNMDIDDLLLNLTGFILGYFIFPIVEKVVKVTAR
ncbi:VanZ family protein [Aquisalibacillus elongatus]|uniref:VanZ like protein n=1 Tax=Aquisalibacillus elongatus TaxID=485577 RepID=A0A3N5C6K8_9BACI|nr:VanZ family protein [Aquisalibacillus elongatus]RPF53935.1 VanZ like protein [Aquisalibacillus elongatus]